MTILESKDSHLLTGGLRMFVLSPPVNFTDTFLHLDLYSSHPLKNSNQNCFLEAQWFPLLKFVKNDLLHYKAVAGGAVIFSNGNHSSSKKERPTLNGDSGYPRPLTQYVIQIEKPSALVQLSNTPDKRILEELVKLLNIPHRGWAAHILIAKMLGHSFVSSDSPDRWWKEDGMTGKAKVFWSSYIQKVNPTMEWRQDWGYFKHIAPNGIPVEYCPSSKVCTTRFRLVSFGHDFMVQWCPLIHWVGRDKSDRPKSHSSCRDNQTGRFSPASQFLP